MLRNEWEFEYTASKLAEAAELKRAEIKFLESLLPGAKTDSDHAVPEEADMWACDACWERFKKEDAKLRLSEGAD